MLEEQDFSPRDAAVVMEEAREGHSEEVTSQWQWSGREHGQLQLQARPWRTLGQVSGRLRGVDDNDSPYIKE